MSTERMTRVWGAMRAPLREKLLEIAEAVLLEDQRGFAEPPVAFLMGELCSMIRDQDELNSLN